MFQKSEVQTEVMNTLVLNKNCEYIDKIYVQWDNI